MTGDWRRIVPPALLERFIPGVRAYQRDLADGHLTVFVGQEPDDSGRPVWHLSISHRTNTHPPRPGRYPEWDEIVEARYEFVPDGVTMAQLLPPRAEWVNEHPTTMHLWEVPQ